MIHVKNLTKKFDPRGIAGLNGVNFSLEKGSIFGIMGPNGGGKSTLLKVLAGIIKEDSGSVTSEGEILFFSNADNTESINVQKFLVDAVTLNIDLDKKIQLARDLASTFEFTFQLKQNLNEVSSGQKQKILLAKELINHPSVILMDEPFTHLDPFMREGILTDLFNYIRAQEITVIWVTHDLLDALKYSDQLAVMNFGKFEQLGTPLEVMKNPRNLFVAKFMGYRNFFPIKEENGSWMTPWGLVKKNESYEEGILVVPDTAWKKKDGSEFKVTHITVTKQSTLWTLEFQGRQVFAQFPIQETLPKEADQVSLSPQIDHCVIIPL